jgi:hypothetical protein
MPTRLFHRDYTSERADGDGAMLAIRVNDVQPRMDANSRESFPTQSILQKISKGTIGMHLTQSRHDGVISSESVFIGVHPWFKNSAFGLSRPGRPGTNANKHE